MKKLLTTFAFLCVCAGAAFGTDITVAAHQMSNLPPNFTNLGAARSITVTTTNGSAVVTSSAAFPANIVNIGGFQVVFSGADTTQYAVSGVASTSSLTLTAAFAGTTGSKTMTLYPYAVMRIYATIGFQDNVSGQNIQPGAPGSGNFYKRFATSVIGTGSSNVAWIPQFTISSTTDGLITNQSRYVVGFYRPDNSFLAFYLCGSVSQLAIPAITPTTWTAICNYNAPGGVVPPNTEVYTKSQIDARFPSCAADQMLYFDVTGNVLRCLTVGTGLSIAGATITATGGAASLPTATFTSIDYNALVTDWLISVTTAAASRTVTLYAAAGNTGRLVTVCKLTTDVNTVSISDGVTTHAVIFQPESCVQMTSTGSVWRIQSY